MGEGRSDIRGRNGYGFIHGQSGNKLCRKYLGKDVEYRENIPLIRLAEMYYILAESVPVGESAGYFNRVRNARGISRNDNKEFDDEDALYDALNKEYQKEFFAEGQWFYFLKRHNYRTFWRCPNTVASMSDNYVLPTPDDEIAYGVGSEK